MMGAKSKSKVDSVKNETYKKNEDYIVIEDLDVQSPQAIENEFQDEAPKLNGAFISSLIVGAIIVIMWVAVYVLYQAS